VVYVSSIVDDVLNFNMRKEKKIARKEVAEAMEKVVKRIPYKFQEDRSIKELLEHINNTYDSHYSKEKFQATEFIIDGGHGTGFCIGNILKYAQRYGKKGTREEARKDLLKILHYAVIQLYVHDTNKE